MKWLLKLGLKFVSYETIVGVMASGIAYIMEYARNKASKDGWEKAKALSEQMKIPLLFTCYPAGLIQASQIADLAPLMPLGLYMRPTYLDK